MMAAGLLGMLTIFFLVFVIRASRLGIETARCGLIAAGLPRTTSDRRPGYRIARAKTSEVSQTSEVWLSPWRRDLVEDGAGRYLEASREPEGEICLEHGASDSTIHRIAFIGNYLPRQCGIATFTTDLCEAIAAGVQRHCLHRAAGQ